MFCNNLEMEKKLLVFAAYVFVGTGIAAAVIAGVAVTLGIVYFIVSKN